VTRALSLIEVWRFQRHAHTLTGSLMGPSCYLVNNPFSCCYNSATCPPDSWCGPTHLSHIGKSRIVIFPCSKPLLPDSPISRCASCFNLLRLSPGPCVLSCDHNQTAHRAFGVRSSTTHGLLVLAIPDFPNLDFLRMSLLSGLSH
jgi:hypothetical protein